jgi:GR25 family glycosyltransferase involved in LPS biosynthesis
MRINRYLDNVKCVVINLKERNDKRIYIQKQLKSNNIIYDIFTATKHENPKRGCLESHLCIIKQVIEEQKKNHIKYLLIIEDDCKFINKLSLLKQPPQDWDMIYLGGTVHRILDRKYEGYARVQCWTTHAYIINLTNVHLIKKLLEVEKYNEEIDRFYLEKIHPNFNAYMCDPMIAIQKEGFSDIENREVSYDFMQYTLKGLRSPEYTIDCENNYILKLPRMEWSEFPKVTI